MTQDERSFKKIAVLTGMTALIGGAEISQSNAATTAPQTLSFTTLTQMGNGTTPDESVIFNDFNPTLGTLTAVQFILNSTITAIFTTRSPSATVKVDSEQIGSSGTSTGPYDIPAQTITDPTILSFVTGGSTFGVNLSLTAIGLSNDTEGFTWNSSSPATPAGLTVDYVYDPVSTTPLPPALPLFTTGLAGLGLTAWRSLRKQKAAKQS
jgi:hypothetical protein